MKPTSKIEKQKVKENNEALSHQYENLARELVTVGKRFSYQKNSMIVEIANEVLINLDRNGTWNKL